MNHLTLSQFYSVDAFWTSYVGILCLIVFAGVSVINVYSPYCKDTFIDRVLYLATAFVSIIGLEQVVFSDYPVNLTSSLVIIFTLRQLNNTAKRVIRHHWPHMGRRFHF